MDTNNRSHVGDRPNRTTHSAEVNRPVGAPNGGTACTRAEAKRAAVQCDQTIRYGRESDGLPTQPARARRQPAPARLSPLIHSARLVSIYPLLVGVFNQNDPLASLLSN
uniref:Uncharacterized protein n=1 Tax=Plectus sambesii TaxID=2011161 RepID=A0A914VHN5_9BILA